MSPKNFIYMCLVFVAFSLKINAIQISYGNYLINNYRSSNLEIHPQNWDIIQTKRNIINFANHTRILEFDGNSWNKISVKNNFVRSLRQNINGTIFVGGKTEIGFLLPDEFYNYKYQSLNRNINRNFRNYSNVYRTFIANLGIYWGSIEYLFRWKNNSIKVWKPFDKFSLTFRVDNKIYIRERGIGLKQVVNDSLVLIPDGEIFSGLGITVMIKFDSERILILSDRKGFFIYNGKNIVPYPTEVDEIILNSRVYYGINLSDGNIALATRQKGVIIISHDGKLVSFFNKSRGLQDNNIKYIFQDEQGNLWLALNNGISKIEYSSSFTFFDKRMGLNGIVLSLTKFNDILYAGTTAGLFRLLPYEINEANLKLKVFEKINEINGNVWSLFSIDDELFVGSNSGLFIMKENKTSRVTPSRTYTISYSTNKENIIFLGTNRGLEKLIKQGNEWENYNLYNDINDRITSIVQSEDGQIWIGTLSKGVISVSKSFNKLLNDNRYEIDESFVTKFDTTFGLPKGTINTFKVANRILFATQEGIFRFDDSTKKFIPDSTFGSQFADGSRGVFRIVEDEKGDVWIHSGSRNFHAQLQPDGSYKIISKPFQRLERKQVNMIYPDGDNIWFGTQHSEIIKYDTKKNKTFVTDFNALVRKVLINGDSLIYGGAPLPEDFEPLSLNYENRNLRFEYACTFYEAEERTVFQYKLDGYDEDWSEWTNETKKDYTNLSEGNYTFNIRAKNVYGDISKIGKYGFNILPPVYRTIWAYFIYAILFVSFGFVIVKWRINKLEKEKQNLEAIVDEKTKEVKHQNIRLAEQADKLKEVDKIKSRFFANISHEFRTPLTLIIGPIEEFLKEEREKEKHSKFSMILRNSKKLLGLINQLLDVSKLESGKMQLNAGKINIVLFAREITFMFESMAVRKSIKLNFHDEVEDIEIYCDTDKIEKVIVNLLSNALKFTGARGEVTVIISKEEQSEAFRKGYVKILVMDTGTGIPQENLEHIFDPFYQADTSSKREFEGTGIGLSLVKEFVELHKGTVAVESEVNKGTKFVIKLPMGKDHLNAEDITESKYVDEFELSGIDETESNRELETEIENTKSSEESKSKNTILVVEDNADVRAYIKQHLDNDYEIIEADNGEDGLERALNIIPDLVISDVMMPKMDGFELCEKLKKDINTSHIPVILLTAKAGDEHLLQGLETGADDYATKPFNVEILLTRVKNLIELRKQIQQKYRKQLLLQPSEIKVSSIEDEFMKKLHELVEENIENPDFNIESLSEKFFMSRSSLFRKIKAITGESPVQFLRSYRLKRAAQLLKAKSGTITEIAFSVGFNNSAYFTKCFKEQFNQLPSEYQSIES